MLADGAECFFTRNQFTGPASPHQVRPPRLHARGGRGPAGRFNARPSARLPCRPPTPCRRPVRSGRTNHGRRCELSCSCHDFRLLVWWGHRTTGATRRTRHRAAQQSHPLRFRWQCRDVTRTPPHTPGPAFCLPPATACPCPPTPPTRVARGPRARGRIRPCSPATRHAPPVTISPAPAPAAGGKNQSTRPFPSVLLARLGSRGAGAKTRPAGRAPSGSRLAGGVRDFPFASARCPVQRGSQPTRDRRARDKEGRHVTGTYRGRGVAS